MSFTTRKREAISAFQTGDVERSMNAHLLPAVPGPHEEPTLSQGRYAKPFVFGALDGLATIFALVAGSVGADLGSGSLLAVGVGNLIAGALGMGIGEYVSSKTDRDVALREEAREKWEVENNAEGEIYEMIQIYESKGLSRQDASIVASTLAKYPKFWIEHMMLTEIGMLPADENDSPALSGFVMFLAFVLFGSVPLLSYYLLAVDGVHPFFIAALSSTVTLFVLGAVKSRFVSKPAIVGGFTMVLQGGLCALSAFCLGDVINSLISAATTHLSLHSIAHHVMIRHSDFSRCLSEATGTYFLVLTVGCNVMVMSGGGAISIGGMLMCMIYALGSVSGAHFNPAVTCAVYLSGRSILSLKEVGYYIGSQLVGACIAGLCYEVVFRGAFILKPVGTYSVPAVMAVETIYSLALCYVVLNVATTTSQSGNQYFGLAIGFTVVSAAVTIANISNCCLNPAVALGSLVAAVVAEGKDALGHYAIYFFMPFLGSAFGALCFYLVRRKDEYDVRNIGLFVVKQGIKEEVPHEDQASINISPVHATQLGASLVEAS